MYLMNYWDISYSNPNGKKYDIADELIYLKKKRKEIEDGNEIVGMCPYCRNRMAGVLYLQDPIEGIAQCNSCFEECRVE